MAARELEARPQVPDLASRFAQGTAAKEAMFVRARALAQDEIVDVTPTAISNSPAGQVARRLHVVGLPIAAFMALNSLACGPQAAAQEAPPKQQTAEAEKPAQPGEVLGGGPVAAPGQGKIPEQGGGAAPTVEVGAGKDTKSVSPGVTEPGKGDGVTKPAPQPDKRVPILTDAEIEKLATDKLKEIARKVRNGEAVPDNEADGFARWWAREGDKIKPTTPPEAQKRVPSLIAREQIPGKINQVKRQVESLYERDRAFNPNQDLQTFRGGVEALKGMVQDAEDAYKNGDKKTADQLLEKARKQAYVMGNPFGEIEVPDSEIEEFDPDRKIISKGRSFTIDQGVKDLHQEIARLRASLDDDYVARAKAAGKYSLAIPSERDPWQSLVDYDRWVTKVA